MSNIVLPDNANELAKCLANPEWRLFSGVLYKIMIKGDDGESVFVAPFNPNPAQRRFLQRLWHRNVILKARQLGFTTLIAILWLDHALFNANQRCGMIAQDRDAAEVIFRDKVKFAYDNLPDVVRERMPLERDSASELLFSHNNSSIRVATSLRSGTIHRLHVSEFGKICAKYPDKAQEVMTGSIPAVPTNGILVVESTAEGRNGDFFVMCETAEANYASKKRLTPRDYRFHFYAWWQDERYRMDASTVKISPEDHDYFDMVQVKVKADLGLDIVIDNDQRAWYVATRDADFKGKTERMWQEYPSFSEEAFQTSTEGHYYARDLIALRKRKGITDVPLLDVPVNTFWDIGNSDGCAIWFHQESNGQDRFVGYYEAHNEDLRHYVAELRSRGFLFGQHFLPHDASHTRLGEFNRSIMNMLQDLMPQEKFVIVPRVTELMTGIFQTRKHLKNAFFDETACNKGIMRIEGYKKRFSQKDNRFLDLPDKSNGCSEGADALRQWAQAKELGMLSMGDGYVYQESDNSDWRVM